MKKVIAAVGLMLMSSSTVFASTRTCEGVSSKQEMAKVIADSEALAILTGSGSVKNIEVFALSDDGLQARANIIFGDSSVLTVKAEINADADCVLDLNF